MEEGPQEERRAEDARRVVHRRGAAEPSEGTCEGGERGGDGGGAPEPKVAQEREGQRDRHTEGDARQESHRFLGRGAGRDFHRAAAQGIDESLGDGRFAGHAQERFVAGRERRGGGQCEGEGRSEESEPYVLQAFSLFQHARRAAQSEE